MFCNRRFIIRHIYRWQYLGPKSILWFRETGWYVWAKLRVLDRYYMIVGWNRNSVSIFGLNSGAVFFKNIRSCLNVQCSNSFPFPTTYMCEAGCSGYASKESKYHYRLEVAADMRIELSTNTPKFQGLRETNKQTTLYTSSLWGKCGVSECDREHSTRWRPWHTQRCCAI